MRIMWGNLKFLHDHDKFYNFTKLFIFLCLKNFFHKISLFEKNLVESISPTQHYYFHAKIVQ